MLTNKILRLRLCCCFGIALFLAHPLALQAQEAPLNGENPTEESMAGGDSPSRRFSLFKPLTFLEYATQIRVEYDDNIFLTEDDETDDLKEVLTQLIKQKISSGDHYWQWSYLGEYTYFDQESANVLGHEADLLYSYRPFDGFSLGLSNNFRWLSDSAITTPIGDRLLALGYQQIHPEFSAKYSVNPRMTLSSDFQYKRLDAKDGSLDDFIDNRQMIALAKIETQLDPSGSWVNDLGFERTQTTFPQISEKASVINRGFVGLTKKFPGVVHLSAETGFARINMDDDNAHGDDNVDFKISLETVFSVYSKMKLAYQENFKQPSLRQEYTQYASDTAAFELTHTLSPKSSVVLNYIFERQDFHNSDALVGQPLEDKETLIHTLGLQYNRKLKNWMTWNLGCNYSKRDTEFAAEGYTNNKYWTGLTMEY